MIMLTYSLLLQTCDVCDDDDHCLPRWEDDGGGMGRPAAGSPRAFAEAIDEASGRDEECRDRTGEEGARDPAKRRPPK